MTTRIADEQRALERVLRAGGATFERKRAKGVWTGPGGITVADALTQARDEIDELIQALHELRAVTSNSHPVDIARLRGRVIDEAGDVVASIGILVDVACPRPPEFVDVMPDPEDEPPRNNADIAAKIKEVEAEGDWYDAARGDKK